MECAQVRVPGFDLAAVEDWAPDDVNRDAGRVAGHARGRPAGRPRRVRHEHDGRVLGGHDDPLDAGVMFPDPDQLGVDLIIPDLTYLEARRDTSRRWS